jgi:hypothetical protein
MKKNPLLGAFILTSLLTFELNAQTVKDAFDPAVKITWLGLDFSGAKYIGDYEHLGTDYHLKMLMASMNELLSNERDKFNIEKFFNKQEVDYKLDVSEKHNADLKTDSTYSNNPGAQLHLKPEDIDKIIAGYDFSGLKGIGLMFNVETLNKISENATIFVTFVNMDTKQVLFTERMSEKPSGFGTRNYWSGAVYGILKEIGSKELKNWRRRI